MREEFTLLARAYTRGARVFARQDSERSLSAGVPEVNEPPRVLRSKGCTRYGARSWRWHFRINPFEARAQSAARIGRPLQYPQPRRGPAQSRIRPDSGPVRLGVAGRHAGRLLCE